MKQTLQKIHQDREEELTKIVKTLNEQEAQKSRALLILDLPCYPFHKYSGLINENYKNEIDNNQRKKLNTLAYKAINEWKMAAGNEEFESRNGFCDFLQLHRLLGFYLHHPNWRATPFTVEHLIKRYPIEGILNTIEQEYKDSTLGEQYKKFASNLWLFLQGGPHLPQGKSRNKPPLNLFEAQKLFEYLEMRALKSTTVRAFLDILICRTLFYAPLPIKKMFDLRAPIESERMLVSDSDSFRVPASYVALWKAFHLNDRLFLCGFEEYLLSQKINRLGRYAGLLLPLTPSVLRASQAHIWECELKIE